MMLAKPIKTGHGCAHKLKTATTQAATNKHWVAANAEMAAEGDRAERQRNNQRCSRVLEKLADCVHVG